MSPTKGKVQELVEQVLMVAGVAEVVARVVSAVAGWLCTKARASTRDDQLKHLRTLVLILYCVVAEAERVLDIAGANPYLRQLLSSFGDAALDGDKVLRLFGAQVAQSSPPDPDEVRDHEAPAPRNMLWNSAKRVLIQSAKSLLFRVDPDADRLNGTVARLERVSSRIGDFLRLLEQELRRRTGAPPAPAPDDDDSDSDGDDDTPPLKIKGTTSSSTGPGCAASRVLDDGSAELERAGAHIGNMIRTGLLMVTANIRQAIGRLRSAPPAAWRPLSTPEPDTHRLDLLVFSIRAAVEGTEQAEVHGTHWLAKWRRELQAVAGRADVALNAVRAAATPAEAATWLQELSTMAHTVEAAAAHLDDFLALVRLTVMAHTSSSRPSKSSSFKKK